MIYQIIANWKSNLDRPTVLEWLVEFKKKQPAMNHIRVAIAPAFTELDLVNQFLNNWNLQDQIDLTAQNVSQFGTSAYTGEVTAQHLQKLGVKRAIIGHSERRTHFHETDADIKAKLTQLNHQQIRPIVAVSQIKQVEYLVRENFIDDQTTIAYEPIESIGTGNPADPDQVRAFTNQVLQITRPHNIKILYGGSVDAQTVQPYLELEQIAGFLVGGASNKTETFLKLLEVVNSHEVQRPQP